MPQPVGRPLPAAAPCAAGCEPLEARWLLASVPAGFADSTFTSGLTDPTAMDFAPDGRLFVCQQAGDLRVVKGGRLLPTPFLHVNVDDNGERGLLGVAFDPNFAADHFVYVYYTATSPTTHNRISRFTADVGKGGDVAVGGSEQIIMDLPDLSSATNHNGGPIHFGPDGKLYVGVGENAHPPNSQSLNTRLGKMLRINPDGSIPADNPFNAQTGGANRSIWALGLRNPYTFSFEPGTGKMFINDVGQDTFEEVNVGQAGANYGWPNTEGHTTNPRYKDPLYAYDHSNACAITGGAFYNPAGAGAPQTFPARYTHQYFYSDYCGNWIHLLDPAAGTSTDFASGISAPVDLKVGPDGALYYLARGDGAVGRIQASAGPPVITTPPRDASIAEGKRVIFGVTASGAAPLSYQWERDGKAIPGATGPMLRLHPTAADNGARYRVVVSNAQGSVTSAAATLTVLASRPPVPLITLPAEGATYVAGQRIAYAGSATDSAGRPLPARAFTWRVDFHDDPTLRPFLPPFGGITAGRFRVPTQGESGIISYRITLTVKDAAGLSATVSREVAPRTAGLTVATSPAGGTATLDGQPVTAAAPNPSVVGFQRTLAAPKSQTIDGVPWRFDHWSDGGPRIHSLATPRHATTYTAFYHRARASVAAVPALLRWE